MIKKNRYNKKIVVYAGLKFDSQQELDYYKHLLEMGHKDIILQPKFELQAKFTDSTGKKHMAINYIADFQIGNVVIDVKGVETTDFKIKKKMFLKRYNSNMCLSSYADNPLELKIIAKAPKYSGVEWIDYDELKKIRAKRKKERAN